MADDSLRITVEPKAYPIGKARVSFPLYYSLQGRQVWSPLRYANAGLFYGEDAHLQTFLNNITRRPNKDSLFLEMNMYSFQPRSRPRDTKFFKKFQARTSLEGLLDELFLVRDEIRTQVRSADGLDINRKITVVLLDLGPHELSLLRDPRVRDKFVTLLQDAELERLYFVLLAQVAQQVPAEVLAALEWKTFAGEANMAHARSLYTEFYEEFYNINRALVGLLVDKNLETLLPVHDLVYAPSQHKIETTKVAEVEEKAFEDFLKSM